MAYALRLTDEDFLIHLLHPFLYSDSTCIPSSQVVLVVSGIYWTQDVTEGLIAETTTPGSVKAVADTCVKELLRIIDLVRTETRS